MKISVFITSFNQKDYLVEAIESVLGQTLQPYEIIIADDCSTDGSQAVIERYARRYKGLIRPFCHPKNMGIPRNKSFAMKQARGDYVTYLDGDDRFLPRKLEIESEAMVGHPEAGLVYSNVRYIDQDGNPQDTWADGGDVLPFGHVFPEVFGRRFPRGSLFRNELIDLKRLREVGFYDPRCTIYEDWELRIRFAKRFDVVYSGELLVEYRLHGEGISGSPSSLHLDVTKIIYRKNRRLLKDVVPDERVKIKKDVCKRISCLAKRAARQSLGRNHRGRALWYWLQAAWWDPAALL